MATNPFGFGPMGLPSKASQAEDPATKKSRIDALAVKTQVPANVLLAFDERGENVEAKATEIGAWLQGGRKMEEVVPADVMGRAYDIADALYPRAPEPAPAPKEPSKIRDFGNVLGSSLIKGAESIYQGAAVASDLIGNGGTSLNPETSAVGNVFRALASERGEASKRFMAAVSPETLQAMADSAPDGDPLDPSTWTLGKSPSALGYAMLATDVFGSFATTVAAGVLAGPVGAAAAGGLQGGGAASQTAERTIAEMATTPHPDGGMVIDHESSYFKFLIKEGVPREEAIRRTTIAAQQAAFTMTMPVSALGGAATSKIVSPGHGLLAGQGMAARVAGTGALSALEEGSQEAVESMATKAGINTGAGTDLSLTEGTVGDFILGALGGGPLGAASGIPAQQTRDDGSVAGEAGASETTPPGGGALAPAVNPKEGISPLGLPGQEGGAAGLPTPPLGPLSEIAAVSPDLTPQPEAAPRFPDQKPGKEVRLVDPETGVIHDAVVLGETPEGISVRIGGGEILIDPATFDQARIAAVEADGSTKSKTGRAKKGKNIQPSERPAAPAVEGVDDAAAEALREQGFYDLPEKNTLAGQAKPTAAPKRTPEAPVDLTPDEALKRAKIIEDTAKRGGWTPRLKKKHADFMAIAGEQANAQTPRPDDVVGSGAQVAPEKQPDIQEAGQTDAGMVADGRAASPAGGGRDQSGVVPDGGSAGQPAAVAGPVYGDDARNDITLTMREIMDDALGDGERGNIAGASVSRIDFEFLKGGSDAFLDGKTSAPKASSREGQIIADFGFNKAKQQVEALGYKPVELKPKAAPITTPPDARIQPDMLGGNETTETEMATKERRRKEWGRFLAIVEGGKSSDDSSLEGRDVLIRGTRVIIRAKNGAGSDQDYRLDTEGMDRDTVAARVRGALQELDRRAPLDIPPPQASAAPVQAPAAVSPPQVAGATEAEPTEVDSVILKAGTLDRGRVNLSKWPEGWKATYDYHIQGLTSGTGGVNGFFPTKEAAIAAGKKVIADGLRSIAEDRGGSSATPAHIAKAKKIVKWAAGDAGVGTNGTTPGQAPSVQATTGLLSVLSAEKQARAAELAKKLADKARNQTSSGLDPEYITLGGELVKLYLEAGVKKFGQMLRDFAEQTGLTLKQAQEPMRAAYNHVRDNMDLEGVSIDGMDDGAAVLEEARAAIKGSPPPSPTSPDPAPTTDDKVGESSPTATPKPPRPAVSANPNPTGKTYRLENALTTAERRLMAGARTEYVGTVLADLDNAARRANAQLMADGLDIDTFDETGNDSTGKTNQMGWFIREAEAHAKELLKDIKKSGAESIEPLMRDEDTGEFEFDGSTVSNALEFLDTQYSLGIGIDEDIAPGPNENLDGDTTEAADNMVFPKLQAGTRNIDAVAERGGYISMAEAKDRLTFWKKTAADIGKKAKNADKVIIDLYDYKGTWAQPWVDAGYTVLRHDIKTGSDVLRDAWIYDRIREVRAEGKEVFGVLSACPCTTFTGSGARWWAERHDVESPEALAQVFGPDAVLTGAKSALEYNIMLADATRDAVKIANPTGFHVLENPIGRIQDKAKFPEPVARFHPHNFGDPYTKRTQLFGDFNADLPLANVDPVEGSKMQNSLRGSDPLGKEDRSTTPEGFAYAFFMANDPDARKVKDQPVKTDLTPEEKRKARDQAIDARLRAWAADIPKDENEADERAEKAGFKKIGRNADNAPVYEQITTNDVGDAVSWRAVFWPTGFMTEKNWQGIEGTFGPGGARPRNAMFEVARPSDKPTPTRAEVDAAAAETNPTPTPAQAEAENYKTGKVNWRGLTLSIENAKGSTRRKVTPDGKTAWEVVMPADYGRILGTTGADGDHVDFYMGPYPQEEIVYIIDQRDMETGAFDEHKVMIGFKNMKVAKEAYFAGFSDGNGPLRLMSITPMGYIPLVMNLQNNPEAWKKPVSTAVKISGPVDIAAAWDAMATHEREKILIEIGVPTKANGRITSKADGVVWRKWADLTADNQEFISPKIEPILAARAAEADKRKAEFQSALDHVGAATLDAMAVRHAEILGKEPFKSGGQRFTDLIAVGGRTGRYNDAFSLDNKASRKVFEEFTGQKLPKTQSGTREFLKENAPFEFTAPAGVSTPSPATDQDTSPPSEPETMVPVVSEGTATVEASDTMEPMEMQVTRTGPWDFNDTFPAPDADQVGRLEAEGRSPFDANTPDEVVSILTETMAEAEQHAAAAAAWSDEVDHVSAGKTPRFKVPKGQSAIDVANQNLATAQQALADTIGAVQDVWGEQAAKAFKAEAERRVNRERTINPRAKDKAPPAATPFTGLPGDHGGREDDAGPVRLKGAASDADVKWRDWWENGVIPTSRPSELVKTGAFTEDEAAIGLKSWDDLSESEKAKVSAALGSFRDAVKAEQEEIDSKALAERARRKLQRDAEAIRDAEDRLKQSVGRIDELKGGTPKSVVDWGKPLGLRDDSGFVGHGYMVLRKGVVSAFDSLVAAEALVPGDKRTEAGIKRLSDTASKANLPIDWRFVRNAQEKAGSPFRPFSVAGKVQGKSGPRWVEIDHRFYSFLARHGLQAFAGPDDALVSIRRPDGEMVGFGATIRPWETLDEMDAVANPPAPSVDEAEDTLSEASGDAEVKLQAGKIEDFGEKIGGARKDVWSGFKDRLREAEALETSAEPLSKSWPEPDYEKLIEAGVDPWTVGFIRAARDHIPRKPLKSWKLKGWVQGVETLRKFSVDLMDGKIGADEVRDHLAKSQTLKSEVANIIDLYMEVGHGKSLKGLRFHESSYSMLNGVSYKPHRVVWEIERDQAPRAWNTMSRVVVRADTKAEAIDQFKAIHAKMDESGAKKGSRDKNTKFLIYSQRTGEDRTYRIGVKIGRNYVDLRNGITDVKEARRIVADEAEQLQAQLDAMKNVPDVRSDENAPRIGVDHRNGADVTPQQFAETFGFRGVEFGNWVEQGRRQKDLNDAYDALMDLAAIVDIPPRAISLNGALGLAFGARGSGGKNAAAAHYEPGKMVINLTKKQGQGSLAHEWFHALDNHFARKREPKRGSWITDNSSPGGQFTAGVRPEVVDAFLEVKRAIAKTGMKERTQRLDKMRSDPYWSTGIEMHARAFESYVIAKLQDQNASNDYLANVVNGVAYQMQAELAGLGDSYPYLMPDELEVVRPAFDALFATIETRETETGFDLEMREAPTVADLRGDELGDWADIRELGRKAETWYRENLVGSSVLNVATGMNIEFNARGAKKIGGGKGQDLYSSVVALREILADGRLIESAPDRLGRRQIKAIHKIAATISISGRRVEVVATVREKDDGTFHYDLGMDREAGGFAAPTAETEARASALDGDLADLNLDLFRLDAKSPAGWGEVSADPEITEADIMAITRDLNAELGRTGLAGKVNVRVVRELYSRVSGSPIMGRADSTGITVKAGTQVGDIGVMRHEIIHALRSEPLWNRKGGIFTEAEWSALTEAARGEAGIVASVKERYPHLDKPGQVEEMVAELYRLWMDNRDTYTGIERAMLRVEGFLTALANLLRGKGFVSAARVMEQIATGKIGGRGPQGPGGGRRILGASKESDANRKTASDRVRDALGMEMRGGALPGAIRSKFKNLLGSAHWKNPGEFVSNAVTDAMGGDYGTLGLVPGRALFAELGKRLPSAKVYLRLKEEMDAIRNAWHAKSDEVAQEWRKARRADPRANDDLMDLMHRSTLSGVDPSKPDTWKHAMGAAAHDQISRYGDNAPKWAFDVIGQIAAHEKAYAALDERFAALPKAMQDIYRKVRAQYDKMGDDFEKAVLDNIEASMKVAMKRAEKAYRKAVERIRDDGLEGEEKDIALAEAKETLDAVKKRGGWGAKAKISALRKKFESNKLKGPYFPLARFGQFFVTIRNHKGEVVSFSRFEKEAQQLAFIRQKKEDGAVNVQYGVLSDSAKLKGQVDPTFVADIEGMLADSGASDQVMDAIWQRWLETLPDQSIRTSKIHRKGREGWNSDAFRAFGHHMFHGAHQLARLKFGLPLEEALNDADEEAKAALDPNRSGLVVNEMRRRHEFTMNPKGSSAIAAVSGMAFVWYLGATPASAVANLSQTTVIGPGVMASRFKTAGITGSIAAIGKAAKDFAKGKGEAQKSPGITQDEHAAMTEAYRRGTIDKTQAHDQAAVAETSIEYNSTRELWMRRIGWMFHHAERFNREVTFLAAYRLARGEGATHADAIDAAADTTWTIHFDYQNCVDDQTEILTIDGWKMWNQVKAGDRILSTDDTGMAVEIGVQEVNVFHRPQEIALFEAKGTRRFSMAVTDDHKCVAVKESKSGGKRGFTAPHFVEAKSLDQRHHLLRAPLAPLDRPESIGTDMAALIGWFAAEGWYARNRGAKEKNNVRLEQSLVKNPEHVAEIDGILSRLGPGFSRGVVKQGRHVLWSLSGPLAKAVQAAVPDKLLPWSLLATMSAHEMSALLDAFVKGDGNRKGKNDCITITQKGSTNRQNLEVLQAMATALGKTASIGDSATRDMSWLTMPGNGRIQTTKTAVAHLERKRLSVPMVWCPTTDNGRWIARRNGCVFVTGNTSRPRIMQNDLGKIATIFRNYTVNLAWRMFRDAHQSLSGATKEERAEARMQLVGTTLSMMLHAGIKGTYGYGIIMLLLSMFFPGDSDDIEEWLQDALLMEGDGLGAATWNYAMGAALNGVPGQLLGVDLTDRIGSPNLWFRGSSQDLEGADLYNHYVGEILGPTYGLGYGFFRGASMAFDDPVRAFEAAAPKILRDIVKTGRYAIEGVETMGGDDILESVNPYELLMQASGFTPARVSERFDMNTRLKNKERQITDERKGIHKQAVDAVLAGKPISQSVMDEISDFNRRFPEYPITSDTIRQSAQGRMRAQKNAEFGVTLNPKISTRLRDDLAPSVYN